ncbi:fungal fruit body lectin [Aspergillus leporis]|jgi:hypothetical protein|uniref:Fungal fruit body lectin n=1 Tax=Aspergillus leporis TaxID=41062 RepID=A0A5N5WIH5_9EURO|nr:fungal fruit body lectin [Aspergillus leporis]
MGGSGTSGILRFKSSCGETFTVALGIHNYNVWCDAQVNLRDDETAVKMHPEYYNRGSLSDQAHSGIFKGTKNANCVGISFTQTDGNQLPAVLYYNPEKDRRVY